MRMPWQRRSAGRAEPENAVAPVASPHAWRSVPPLVGSAGGPPPLTARSVELADALSRRLRSTRERPPLVHRAGFPDPAAPGTVRGLAVASPRAAQGTRSASGALITDGEGSLDAASDATPAPITTAPPVKARRSTQRSLTSADPGTLVFPVRENVQQVQVDEVEATDTAETVAPAAPAGLPQGLQRTVVRRRSGAPGA